MGKVLSIATIILVVLMFWGTVIAAPFLVCDEYINPSPIGACLPDQFLVQFDGGAWITSTIQIMPNSNVRLHHDLSTLATGNHTVKAKAKCSMWNLESGESLPFVFSKPGSVGVPGGIVISPQ